MNNINSHIQYQKKSIFGGRGLNSKLYYLWFLKPSRVIDVSDKVYGKVQLTRINAARDALIKRGYLINLTQHKSLFKKTLNYTAKDKELPGWSNLEGIINEERPKKWTSHSVFYFSTLKPVFELIDFMNPKKPLNQTEKEVMTAMHLLRLPWLRQLFNSTDYEMTSSWGDINSPYIIVKYLHEQIFGVEPGTRDPFEIDRYIKDFFGVQDKKSFKRELKFKLERAIRYAFAENMMIENIIRLQDVFYTAGRDGLKNRSPDDVKRLLGR